MKCLLPIAAVLVTMVAGCTNYAEIEQARLGMTIQELRRIDTPCYYSGESDEKTTYKCKFAVPTSPYTSGRSLKPYILVFEDDKLTEIKIDEKELDRETIRDEFHFQYRYYYPYGYPYYYHHYPYWYP